MNNFIGCSGIKRFGEIQFLYEATRKAILDKRFPSSKQPISELGKPNLASRFVEERFFQEATGIASKVLKF
jgi:hypothetical protein